MLKKVEFPLVVFFSLLLLTLSMAQIIYRYKITPPDRVYLGQHEFYTDDYSIYVSNIFQGQLGRWTLLDKHTSEAHVGTIIHDEYLLWGKLTSLFKIGPIISYHLFRFSMGFILLLVIYKFLKILFPNNSPLRLLSFLFILFSFGFPKITQSASGTTVKQFMDWYKEFDVFSRFVALPHYLLGNTLFILNVILFFKFSNSKFLNSKFLILNSATAVLAALIHPIAAVSLCAYYAVFIFLSFFLHLFYKNYNNYKYYLIYFFVTVLSTLPVILYYKQLMSIPPWNHMAAWEGVSQYHIPITDFIGALGPNFFLAPIGLLFMLKDSISKKFANQNFFEITLFLFSWIFTFFLLIYFSYPILHISEVRFMQVFIFIPFAILSAYAIYSLSRLINIKFIAIIIFIIFMIYLPLYISSFKDKLFYHPLSSTLVFPYLDWMKGIYYLRDNTPKSAVVLAAYQAATTIPFVSGNTVYTGHLWATLDRSRKEPLRDKFLRNIMTEKEAYDFFSNEKIDYYFHGFQEAGMGIYPQNYKFLKPVFSNSRVIIYKFIQNSP